MSRHHRGLAALERNLLKALKKKQQFSLEYRWVAR